MKPVCFHGWTVCPWCGLTGRRPKLRLRCPTCGRWGAHRGPCKVCANRGHTAPMLPGTEHA